MTDYYSQRLQETQEAKEARLQSSGLPLMRPMNRQKGTDTDLKTMAAEPTQEPQQPDSFFKTMFDNYSQEDSFKTGMEEFATIMQTMRKDMDGISLPPELLENRVREVVEKYKQGAMGRSQQPAQDMGGAMTPMMNQGDQNGGV